MNKFQRFVNSLNIVNQVFIPVTVAIIIGPLVWWYLDDTPPIKWLDITPINEEVPAGGTLRLNAERIMVRSCDGYRVLTVVDSLGISFDTERLYFEAEPPTGPNETDSDRRPTRPETRILLVNIPIGAAPGKARHYATYTWFCNPLQHAFPGLGIKTYRPDVLFTILPGRLDGVLPRSQHPTRGGSNRGFPADPPP